MRKTLNKKGFTLIELLAVIVVLAIILVITVPMVLNSISSTRQDAFDASARGMAKFVKEQIGLAALGKNDFLKGKIVFDKDGKLCSAGVLLDDNNECSNYIGQFYLSNDSIFSSDDINLLDINDSDYDLDSCQIEWDSNSNVTVRLTGTDTGKFKGLQASATI